MNFYPHHIGDYISHTAHLSNEEDLAYRRLIELYYQTEGPLSLDVAAAARAIRMRDQKDAVEAVLSEFFVVTESGYQHGRCDEEIAKYHGQIEAGKRGAAKRWGKGKDREPIGTLLAPQCDPNSNQNQNQNHEPIKSTPLVDAVAPTPVDKSAKGMNCPHQKLVDLFHAECKSLAKVARLNEQRKTSLASLWKTVRAEEKHDTEQQTLEYFEAYFHYVEQSDFLCGRTGNGNFIAGFDWILKPANFTKTIEGNYHRRAA